MTTETIVALPKRSLPTGSALIERLEQLASHADYNEWAETARTVRGAKAEIEAMRSILVEARSGLSAYTGGPDGACSPTIARIDALLSA